MEERSLHPGGERLTRSMLRFCEPVRGFWIDIGCGSGRTVRLLSKNYGVNVVGVDIDKNTVARAETLGGRFLLADAHELPFRDGTAEGILMECCLSLMHNVDRVISECRRVLRTGGCLCISDVYARQPGKAPSEMAGHLYTQPEIERLFEDFSVLAFEDHSGELLEYWGQRILDGDGIPECWGDRETRRNLGIGYYSMVGRRGKT